MSEQTALFAEIVKVEKPDAGTRLVHTRISDETKDLDGQVADYGWLKSAVPDWYQWGNVREMHQSNVVGKATDLIHVPDEKGFDGVLKIVDPLAIRKLDEDLYGGVSIGIRSPRVVNEKGASIPWNQPGRIVGGKIVEVSLVDHPANENCKLKLVLAKSATGNRGSLNLLAEPEEIKAVAAEITKDAHAMECCDDCGDDCDGGCCDKCTMGDANKAVATATEAEALALTVKALNAAGAEIEKGRVFYTREHRTAIEQSLRNLTLLLQGDMQGGAGADPTTTDAPAVADAELMRDGDPRERTPSAVTQNGPATEAVRGSDGGATVMAPNGNAISDRGQQVSVTDIPTTSRANTVAEAGPTISGVQPDAGGAGPATGSGAAAQPVPQPQAISRGTEPDLTKATALDADATKAATTELVKAIFPDLLKEHITVLKEELKGEFAAKSIEADVDKLGKRAQPNNGPHLGEGTRIVNKQFAVNNTVNSGEVPQEILDKMLRLSDLAKSQEQETASSAKTMLKQLTEHYFKPIS